MAAGLTLAPSIGAIASTGKAHEELAPARVLVVEDRMTGLLKRGDRGPAWAARPQSWSSSRYPNLIDLLIDAARKALGQAAEEACLASRMRRIRYVTVLMVVTAAVTAGYAGWAGISVTNLLITQCARGLRTASAPDLGPGDQGRRRLPFRPLAH